jgi:zinc D-Ala-D-Ala dipeptidase
LVWKGLDKKSFIKNKFNIKLFFITFSGVFMERFFIKAMLLITLYSTLYFQCFLEAHQLVDLQKFIPKLCVDLGFSNANPLYSRSINPYNRVFVEYSVAIRLKRVQKELAKEGIGLIVLEGYRPPSIQNYLDHLYREKSLGCVREEASHYCKGMGVDVMLYYLSGLPIKIPCFYQLRNPRAHRDYPYLSANEYHNSYLLEKCMVSHGFVPQREKWWHFDLKGWENVPNLEIEYSQLLY